MKLYGRLLLITLFLIINLIDLVGLNEDRIESVSDLCIGNDFTIIYSLSVTDCLGCYNSKIMSLNQFFTERYSKVKIIYVFHDNLSMKELSILQKKYSNGIVVKNNDIAKHLHLDDNAFFLLFDGNCNELVREKLHLIKNIDESILSSQKIKFTKSVKLNDDNNILFLPSKIKYNDHYNEILVLDNIQNVINSYNITNGKINYQVSIPKEINEYFQTNDTLYKWKWQYAPPSEILNYCSDIDTIFVFYKVYSVKCDFTYSSHKNQIDTNLVFLPNVLIAKYYKNKLKDIIHFKNNSYHLDFEVIDMTNDGNYIISGFELIDNNFPYEENPDSLSVLLLMNSSFNIIDKIVTKKDFQRKSGKKYFSFFGINKILEDNNRVFIFNLLNKVLAICNLSYEKNNKLILLRPYGIIKEAFDIIDEQKIKPWNLLKNSEKYTIPSPIIDIGLNDRVCIVFAAERNFKKQLINISIITYYHEGFYKKSYSIDDEKIDDFILDIKYVGYSVNNNIVLIKWQNDGWCLHYLPSI